MTDEAVLISITISVSKREVKFEKEARIMDIEEAIQGIMLEAGQQTLEMVIQETDEQMTEKVPKSWQNIGTEERKLQSSMGTLRYKPPDWCIHSGCLYDQTYPFIVGIPDPS